MSSRQCQRSSLYPRWCQRLSPCSCWCQRTRPCAHLMPVLASRLMSESMPATATVSRPKSTSEDFQVHSVKRYYIYQCEDYCSWGSPPCDHMGGCHTWQELQLLRDLLCWASVQVIKCVVWMFVWISVFGIRYMDLHFCYSLNGLAFHLICAMQRQWT